MKYKNHMHATISVVTVAAMLMNGSVHRVPKVEAKTKAKTEDYVAVNYNLEDQQILQTKVEVRKQQYIKEQIEEERQRLKKQREEDQRLREQERKRQEQLALDKEQNKQIKYNIVATAYTSTCKGCSGITYTGYNVKNTIYYKGLKIIATDNSIIPLYSIVLVEARNETFKAIVLDRGGGIKGMEADVLVENENVAVQFGRQNVTITVLRKGE